MTQDQQIKDLKKFAKKIARSKRLEHHDALNSVAQELGHTHWYAAMAAHKNGWRPSPDDLAKVEDLLRQVHPDDTNEMFGDPGGESQGLIGPHAYSIDVSMDEVFVRGRGWMVHVPEAPSRQPCVRVTDKRFKVNPIHDPEFVARALEIANVKAEQVRARIASDWSRRSTMPDAKGCAVHPISGGSSDTWFCLHCDEQSSAKSVAANLWHCPHCSASPMDIFSSAWWLEDASEGHAGSA